MDVFPKKLSVKVPKPGAAPAKPKDIFIKETEDEAAQREKERRRCWTTLTRVILRKSKKSNFSKIKEAQYVALEFG